MRACLLAHRTAGSRAWLLRDGGELLWFSVSCSNMRVLALTRLVLVDGITSKISDGFACAADGQNLTCSQQRR